MIQLRSLISVILFGCLQTNPVWAASESFDLLAYMKSNISTTTTNTKYNRAKDFGGWVYQDSSNSCHDTREMVLDRADDSQTPVEFSGNGCTIISGLWHEPYTGTDVQEASALQIDHVVPLKLAFYAGAYAWSEAQRCNYANYIGNDYHLQAVSGHENMAKGDKGPAEYLPPSHEERCTYVSDWMKIEAIWQLTTTQQEVDAIENVIKTEHCSAASLIMTTNELSSQRAKAATTIQACVGFHG